MKELASYVAIAGIWALQAAALLPPRPNIHAAFGQIEAWIHF